MKKRFLLFLLVPMFLSGCTKPAVVPEEDTDTYNTQTVEHPRKMGDIGGFNLTGPANGYSAKGGFIFTWEQANNADFYQLEIANTETFINNEDVTYVKEGNISTNQYYLNLNLSYDL